MTLKKTKCHFYCRASLCFYGRVVGRELVTKKPGQNYVMAYPNQGLKVFGNSRPVSVSEVQRGEGGELERGGLLPSSAQVIPFHANVREFWR